MSERPRAVVVVTGSELVRGERTDRNGPFLAAEALSHGLEPARITIVGDSPAELEAVLREGLEADACLVSGGLGPTHDDRTVELLARAAGLDLVVDEALEQEIEAISRAVAERLRRPYGDFAAGVTKQATRPVPAVSIGLAGTAPGLVFRAPTGCVVVVLPGPPSELRRLWPNALASDPMRELLARTRPPGRRVLRLFGVSESAVARALEEAGGDGGGVEATICAREFEIHVDLVVEPGAEERGDALDAGLSERLGQWLFARDERRVEELVLSLAGASGLRLATAESCTGGLVAARLTSVPGSSASFVGGVVSYADEVKRSELDVPEELLATHGAVSAEVAAAMAEGARRQAGRRRRGGRHRRRRSRWRNCREACGSRLPPCRWAGRLGDSHARPARAARADPGTRDGHGPSSSACASDGKSRRIRMSSAASVSGDERLRLFLALRLPDEVLDEVERWQREHLAGRPRRTPRASAHHARVPRPPAEWRARIDRRRASRSSGCSGGDPARARAATARRGAPACSFSRTKEGTRRCSPGTSRSGWNASVSTAAKAGPGCRTSRWRGGASGRGSSSSRRRWERLFRPTRLLTYPELHPGGARYEVLESVALGG